jgi:hypothetical protein
MPPELISPEKASIAYQENSALLSIFVDNLSLVFCRILLVFGGHSYISVMRERSDTLLPSRSGRQGIPISGLD